jgi:nitrogen fixation protein FixH
VTLDFLATRLPVEEVNDSTVTLEARDPEGFLHREEVSEAAWKANPEQLAMDIMKRSRPRPPTTKL